MDSGRPRIAGRGVQVQYQKLAAALLDEWRGIERRLDTVDPLTDEADELKPESHRLHAEYQLVIDEAAEYHRLEEIPPAPATLAPDPEFTEDAAWLTADVGLLATGM